jgi:hypothetical protein
MFGFWTWDGWNALVAIGTIALAVMTLLIAAVAVYQEPLRRRFLRARVRMTILLEPPDAHMIDGIDPRLGKFLAKLLYIRIRVTHVGGSAAENVEIMANGLWKRRSANEWEPVKTFLPLGLTWSHVRVSTMRVPAGIFRHCDLGFLSSLNPERKPTFRFDLIVQPNAVAGGVLPNELDPGEYLFELVLVGDNVKRITKRWRFKFSGPWSDDETTMLSRIELEETS